MKRERVLTGVILVSLVCLFFLAANHWQLPWASPERPEGVAWCETHDEELDKCEICNPALARGGTQLIQASEPLPGQCPNMCVRVVLGEGVAEQVGLELSTLEATPVEERLRANAETQFLPQSYARLAPRASGAIQEVRVQVGDEVAAGSVLAVLDSPDLGRIKSTYIQALSTLKLRQTIHDSRSKVFPKITTSSQMAEAVAALHEAQVTVQLSEQQLGTYGLRAEEILAVKDSGTASPLLEMRAPFDATVVSLIAVRGELADPTRPIISVADTTRMWLVVDVYEQDLERIEPGQRVRFFVEGLVGKRFSGRVVAVGAEVSELTRTVQVFADVKNREGLLKANMFGQAEVRIAPAKPMLLIPRAAVQNDGDCLLAFVSSSKDTFVPRPLELGAAYDGGFEIVGGLAVGDRVVTTGSFLLKTEILRGQIGAG